MRYWIYKDSQIIGPIGADEVRRVEGAGPSLLICPEGTDGSRTSDWKTVDEIPELAGMFSTSTSLPATLEAPAPEFKDWPIRDFSAEELIGLPYFQFWEPHPYQAHRKSEQDIEANRFQAQELETKLAELETKIAQYDRHQGEILDRLIEKDSLLENQQKEIQRLKSELEQSKILPVAPMLPEPPPFSLRPQEVKAPAPEIEPKPEIRLKVEVQPKQEPKQEPEPKPDVKPVELLPLPAIPNFRQAEPLSNLVIPDKLEFISPLGSTERAEVKPKPFDIPAALAPQEFRFEPQLTVKTFAPPTPIETVKQEPPAIAPAVPAPPAFESPIAMSPASSEPAETNLAALANPSITLSRPDVSFGSTSGPGMQDADPFSLPRTTLRTPDLPAKTSDLQPPTFGSSQSEIAQPPSFATISSAEPQPAPTQAPKRSSKVRIFALAVLALFVLAGAAVYLMKGSSKGTGNSTSTDDSNTNGTPLASSSDGNSQQFPSTPNLPVASTPQSPSLSPNPMSQQPTNMQPTNLQPQAQPGMPSQNAAALPPGADRTPVQSSPQVSASPEPAPLVDHSQEAIDLVKNYSLDSKRGTVEAWLQYSYPPGSREKWTANPGENPGSFIVQYQVTVADGKPQTTEPPVYMFEADLGNKTVSGFNQSAKELLTGTLPHKAKSKPARKLAAKSKKHKALKPGQIPLLPLPSDADLRRAAHK